MRQYRSEERGIRVGRRGARVLVAVVLLALVAGTWGFVQVGGTSIGLNPVDGVALIVAVAGAAGAWRRRALRLDLALVGYIALVAIAVVQVFVLPEPWQTATGAGRLMVLVLLLFGLTQLRVERGWSAGLATGGVALVVLVVASLSRGATDPAVLSFYDLKHHIVTPMGASNLVAAVLAVAFLGLLGAALRTDDARRSRLLSAAALAVAVGLAATLSRGAAVAVLASVVAGAAILRSVRLVVVAGACAAVGAAGVVLLTSPLDDGGTRVVTAAEASTDHQTEEASDEVMSRPSRLDGVARSAASARFGDRGALASSAVRATVEHPLTGVGLNRFDTAADHGSAHDHAHNLGLHVAASTGILGLVAYLGIWGLLALRLFQLPSGPIRTGLALAATGLFLHSQIEALALTRAHEVLLVLMLAITATQPGARAVVTVRPRPVSQP